MLIKGGAPRQELKEKFAISPSEPQTKKTKKIGLVIGI
jgi:hypothetical protein